MSGEFDLDALEAAAKATGDDDHLCISKAWVLALIARIHQLEAECQSEADMRGNLESALLRDGRATAEWIVAREQA